MLENFTSQKIAKENDILPYEVKDIPDGSWIVFSPHFDDETIGMGGSLLLAKQKQKDISLVVVTDGSLGGANTETREDETKNIVKELNIKELILLNHKDREIIINDTSIKEVSDILEKTSANVVFIPSGMELHPDHRITAELVWKALAKVNKKFEIFAYEISLQNQINYLVDITSVMENKKTLMALYPSQLKQNNYIQLMTALNKLRTYTLTKDIQYAEGFYYYGNDCSEDYKSILSKRLETYTKQYLYPHNVFLSNFNIACDKDIPLVSIVIPCYNDGEYIQEAINSVYQQTYRNIEIIIIDDSSTQNLTIKKLKEIENYNLKLIYLEKNVGPSIARNKGIKEAKGKYILPLDADDRIHHNYIEESIKILEKDTKIGIVYSDAEFFGDIESKWNLPEYSFEDMFTGNHIFSTAFFKKSDWERVGGYNQNMKEGWEDYDFWISLLELGCDVFKIDEVLFYYRKKDISRTTKISDQKSKLILQMQVFENHKDFYLENMNSVFKRVYKLSTLIDNKNIELNNQKVKLNHNNKTIEQYKKESIQDKKTIEQQKQENIQNKKTITQQKQENIQDKKTITQQKQENIQNKKTIEQQKQEIMSIFKSNSWKLTKPLRKFAKIVKGNK